MVARVPVSEKPYMGMPSGGPTAANHRRPSEMRGGVYVRCMCVVCVMYVCGMCDVCVWYVVVLSATRNISPLL